MSVVLCLPLLRKVAHKIETIFPRSSFPRSSVPRAKFLADIPALLKAGQEVWTGWFGEDEVGPLNTACFCSEAICDDQ